jgi:hypothetical protein
MPVPPPASYFARAASDAASTSPIAASIYSRSSGSRAASRRRSRSWTTISASCWLALIKTVSSDCRTSLLTWVLVIRLRTTLPVTGSIVSALLVGWRGRQRLSNDDS